MNVIDRFLSYVAFDTTSDEDSATVPSTPNQKLLGAHIAEELKAMGLKDPHMDDTGYVYAFLPATPGRENDPAIGFIAHMDTSPAVSGANIKPRRVVYKGGELALNDSVALSPAVFPFLDKYIGQELIVTDGTTLLGSDDKAGVAEIVTAMEFLLAHPEIPHGPLAVGFTPDEEIGRGADCFDVAKFACDFAYTVDGGALGELEYENFNAASARIAVHGINIHPGSAKDKMKNAALILTELVTMLPPAQAPAHTEGYEGFFHVCELQSDESEGILKLIIRDHDRGKFEEKKALLQRIAAFLNDKYGAGTVEADIKDSYYNMKEKILPVMHVIMRAQKAMELAGVTPVTVPIRGGTDGARLSYMGLPCPNLSTGGENFHGIHEFVSVPAMEKMVEVIVNIARL